MITISKYHDIINRLNFNRSIKKSLWIFGLDMILLICAFFLLLKTNGLILYCISQLLFSIVFLHSFIILHECGHNTLSKKNYLNIVIGHISSIFCFMPFYPWKYIHDEHHKWTGHLDKDPVFVLLKQAKAKKKLPLVLRLGWRTLLPIGVFFLHLVYWSYPIKLILLKKMNPKILTRCLFSCTFLFLAYYIINKIYPEVFSFKILPAIILYAILWETLSTPQHLGMPSTTHKPSLKDHAYTTRTTRFPYFLERYLFLNFGFHIEHHFFPTLPWHELNEAHKLLKPLLGTAYNEVIGGVWNIKMRSQNMEKVLGIHD